MDVENGGTTQQPAPAEEDKNTPSSPPEQDSKPPPPAPPTTTTTTLESLQDSKPPFPLPPPAAPQPPLEDPLPPRMSDKVKRVTGLLAIFTFLLSLPILAAGISLLYMRDYDCEDVLKTPHLRISIGVGLLILFCISNLVVHYGSRLLMPTLVAVVIPLMLMLTIGLALVGAYTMESRAVPASPMWLKERVGRSSNWDKIKRCLYEDKICLEMGFRMLGISSHEFSLKKLSRIESGCCTPPSICGMEFVNATCWMKDRLSNDEGDYVAPSLILGGDCVIWDNAPNRLCYDCETCKLGFLKTLQRRWKRLGIFLVIMALFLTIAHIVLFVANMADRPKT